MQCPQHALRTQQQKTLQEKVWHEGEILQSCMTAPQLEKERIMTLQQERTQQMSAEFAMLVGKPLDADGEMDAQAKGAETRDTSSRRTNALG